MQAFFLVADDVMDSSVTRRGQPCWYKKVRELFLEWGVKLYSNCRILPLVLQTLLVGL